jgi:type VI secretion system protein ImpG
MSETLYRYYERELLFIRQMAQEFARQYPAAASRLMLEPNRSVDPHVERLLEGFSFLTARIQQKLDDDFPELTDALLGVLYPHYLRPIPSFGIVEFQAEAANAQTGGVLIPRGSKLHTRKLDDLACQFRTCYDTTLWPIELIDARLQSPPFPPGPQPPPKTAAILRLSLACQGDLRFANLKLESLRLHLYGDSQLTARLYELLFNHTLRVAVRSTDKHADVPPVVLEPEECLRQVGFERDQGLLPYPPQSFLGYRLLTELFAFPQKFLFVDLAGWQRVAAAGMGREVEFVLYLDRTLANLEQEIGSEAFRLGCTPIVNLFPQTCEPIPLTHARTEYRVTPDVHQPLGMEVYSIDEVTAADPRSTTQFQPFYTLKHENVWSGPRTQRAFWHSTRRASLASDDPGTDVYLHLVDLDFNPRLPADSVLIVRATCTNRNLPTVLQQAGDALAFELEAAVPLAGIRTLRSPTAPLRPPLARGAHWRLMSHLTLNHLSLTDDDQGRAALQEILRLYDFSDPQAGAQLAAVNKQLIEGVLGLSSRRTVARIDSAAGSGFCRGTEITLELDEQKYIGTGAFLFASVLERFLGLYASVNSFTQLVARTRQGESELKRWPPRAGELQLV